MPEIIATLNQYLSGLLAKTAVIVLIGLVIDITTRQVMARLEKRPGHPWLNSLVSSLRRFAPILIWGTTILIGLEVISEEKDILITPEIIHQGRNIFLTVGFAAVLFLFKTTFAENLLTSSLAKDPNNRALIDVASRLFTIILVTVAGITVLDILGVPLNALLAFGGIGGIAVSWAAKDVIANFFGGLMIFANRPFLVGDWIKSPNKNFEGVVEQIGWYMTRIRTFDRRPTFIPNSVITDAIIENPGRMYNRRIKTMVGLRYCDVDSVNSVTKKITEMLKAHPEIDQKQFLMVHLLEFGPSSLNIEIYTFTKTTNWEFYREIQQDVLLKVAAIVAEHGAEIAFPTTTVHLDTSSSSSQAHPAMGM